MKKTTKKIRIPAKVPNGRVGRILWRAKSQVQVGVLVELRIFVSIQISDGVILEKPDPEELKDSEPSDENDGKKILTAGSKKSGNSVEKSSYLLSTLTLIFVMIL